MSDPSLAQRVEWTHGFRCATDKAVLKAMARWFAWRADGRHVRFTVAELAYRAGVPKRSTERALERLEEDWRIEITARTHRRPTTYRIVLERLATADPEALHVTGSPPEWRTNEALDRHSGGQDASGGQGSLSDSDKVADQRSAAAVRTDPSDAAAADPVQVRHSGGQGGGQPSARPEHPDVPAFLEWARVTYPQHAAGAQLVINRAYDGHLIHGLLEHYPLARLQAMTVAMWTLEADGDPKSPASWIAHGDRSLRVLRHKAPFLERVVVGAQQLGFVFSARELEEAADIRKRVYLGCPHEPRCDGYAACVREIAYARKVR
jgi:hypothetical protein